MEYDKRNKHKHALLSGGTIFSVTNRHTIHIPDNIKLKLIKGSVIPSYYRECINVLIGKLKLKYPN
jgi:hypothetical protein